MFTTVLLFYEITVPAAAPVTQKFWTILFSFQPNTAMGLGNAVKSPEGFGAEFQPQVCGKTGNVRLWLFTLIIYLV